MRTAFSQIVLLSLVVSVLLASVAIQAGPTPWCMTAAASEQKDAGYADWTAAGTSLPASVTVTNPWPDVISNELVFFGWPTATTLSTSKVVIVVRQVGTDNYGTYATIRLHNEQGDLNLYPLESQHITGDLQAFKYVIGQSWTWGGGAYLTVTIVSDLLSTATVELNALWVE